MSDEIVVPEYCLVALDAVRVALKLLGESVVGATLKTVTDLAESYQRGVLTELVSVHALTARGQRAGVLCRVRQGGGDSIGWQATETSIWWGESPKVTLPHTFNFEGWGVRGQSLSERLEAAKIAALRAILEICRQIDVEFGAGKTVGAFLESLKPESIGVEIFTGDLGDVRVSVRPGLGRNFELAECFVRMNPIVPTVVVLNIYGVHPFRLRQGRWERIEGWASHSSLVGSAIG